MILNKIQTVFLIIWAWLIHTITLIIPRSPRIWIFTGWHRTPEGEIFADNSKYMYLHAAQTRSDITAIWISQDEKLAARLRKAGYPAHSVHTWRGIYYSLRAGYTFVDAFVNRLHWQYSGGSKIIQLWHGKGMKKTGHDSDYSLKRYNSIWFPNLFIKFYKLVASSPYTARLMASTFRVPQADILISGLPRNDILFKDIPGAEIDAHHSLASLARKVRATGVEKVIMYAPTFRPNGSNPLDTLDLDVLHQFLKAHKFYLVLSLHPKLAARNYALSDAYTHIGHIPAGFDIYPQLREIDTLITDYSSLYVDFLLLDRPIIFYTYDLENYKNEMGLHDDFENLTPGPHVSTMDELMNALSTEDTHKGRRADVRAKLFTYQDGDSAQRIINMLEYKLTYLK